MKKTSVIALSLALGLLTTPISLAQSNEDPLGDFESFFAELDSFESENSESFANTDTTPQADQGQPTDEFDAFMDSAPADANTTDSTENTAETPNEADNTVATSAPLTPTRGNLSTARLQNMTAPEGKENHVLYNIPGAIEHNGMTFINIDSRKFFNRYQKCDIAETDTITSTLSRLKLSQGAPLTCREDMKYKFLPYKNFRTIR